MTPRQLELLEFVRDTIATTAVAPTYSEMQGRMGLASKSGIARMVDALVAEGLLVRSSAKRDRNLRLPVPSLAAVPTAVLTAEIERRCQGKRA